MLKEFKLIPTLLKILWAYKRGITKFGFKPLRLWIEPTSFCNLTCPMCPNRKVPSESKGFMKMELFKKIIDEAAPFVYDINIFLGGESLMHKELPAMIGYARKKNIRVRLSTNAVLLNPDKSEALLKAGLNHITFSFDGYDKATYEKVRVHANFDKTLSNIIDFLKIKQRLRSKDPFTVLQVIEFDTLAGRNSESSRETFCKKFEGLDLNRFVKIKPHNWGGAYSEGAPEDYRAKGNKYVYCTFLWYSMNILWDGRVVPCCADFGGENTLGNLSSEGLLDIWNGDKILKLRKKIVAGDYKDLKLCKGCDMLWKEGFLGVPVKSIIALKSFINEK